MVIAWRKSQSEYLLFLMKFKNKVCILKAIFKSSFVRDKTTFEKSFTLDNLIPHGGLTQIGYQLGAIMGTMISVCLISVMDKKYEHKKQTFSNYRNALYQNKSKNI